MLFPYGVYDPFLDRPAWARWWHVHIEPNGHNLIMRWENMWFIPILQTRETQNGPGLSAILKHRECFSFFNIFNMKLQFHNLLSLMIIMNTGLTVSIYLPFGVYEFVVLFNSLWPSDNILWHRSGSTLAQLGIKDEPMLVKFCGIQLMMISQ